MARTPYRWLRPGALALPLLALFNTGCFLLPIVPVQPWVAERMYDKYGPGPKNDQRTPIMPPLREGFPAPICEDPPSELEVLRAMPRVTRGVPFVYEEHRDNVEITYERLVDKIDPPRFFPLVGPAQLHHCHWKCTIFYKETVQSSYPFPTRIQRNRVEVVYIDKDHLHLFVGPNPTAQAAVARDLGGP